MIHSFYYIVFVVLIIAFHRKSDYLFGVERLFVLAPTRFGAHNWEAVGELSALWSLEALRYTMEKLKHAFGVRVPLVMKEFTVVSGWKSY